MRAPTIASFALIATASLGCADVLGLDAYGTSGTGGGSGGSGGTTGTTTSEGGGGTGGTTSSSTTEGGGGATSSSTTEGGGGAGGTTTTSSSTSTTTECMPGSTEPCYPGPPETEGIGPCKAGARTCDAAGLWGACEGAVLPALELCHTDQVDESCDQLATCTGQLRWVRHFPAAAMQDIAGIAVDPLDDHIVVVGSLAGPVAFGEVAVPFAGGDGTDVFVAKLDPYGKHVWSRSFGSATTDAPLGVAIDATGRIVVVGRFTGTVSLDAVSLTSAGGNDIFVLRLDPDGAALWGKQLGDAGSQEGRAVAVDAAGDVYITGSYDGALDFGVGALPNAGAGAPNVFVARLAGDTGQPVWAAGFDGAGAQLGRAIALDATGAVHVAADVDGAITIGGSTHTSAGLTDIVVARLDAATGAPAWSVRYGNAANQVVTRMVNGGPSGVVVGASVQGAVTFDTFSTTGDTTNDAAVFKLDATGAVQWVQRAGALNAGQFTTGVAADPSGFVVAAGNFNVSIDFTGGAGGLQTATTGLDRFFVKLGPVAAAPYWTRSFPNAAGSVPTALAIDRVGRVVFATSVQGTTDFGSGPLTSPGTNDKDVVIGQLAP